jgi:hypothetical protein
VQILDVYDKDYTCKSCSKTVQYGKVADSDGKLVTTDKKEPNKKYGKDSNVLSGAVDKGTLNLHACYAKSVTDKYNTYTQPSIGETAINSKPGEPAEVKWYSELDQLTPQQSNLYHGYHDLNKIAYILTKEQRPTLPTDGDLFGQIASAKATVLSNMLVSLNLKDLRLELAKPK